VEKAVNYLEKLKFSRTNHERK